MLPVDRPFFAKQIQEQYSVQAHRREWRRQRTYRFQPFRARKTWSMKPRWQCCKQNALKESQDRVKLRFAAQQSHVWGNGQLIPARGASKEKEEQESPPPLWMYRTLESGGLNTWVDGIKAWRERVPPMRPNKSPLEVAEAATVRARRDALMLDQLFAAAELRKKMFWSMLDRMTDVKSQ